MLSMKISPPKCSNDTYSSSRGSIEIPDVVTILACVMPKNGSTDGDSPELAFNSQIGGRRDVEGTAGTGLLDCRSNT